MRRTLAAVLALALLPALASAARAQGAAADSAAREWLPRVFLDCTSPGCDLDYFRKEIAFVDHVRDPRDADVHVLVTSQATGSGGTRYTLNFIGRRRFAGAQDTLHHVAGESDTQDELRAGLVRVLKLGLVRYAAASPAAARISVAYTAPAAAAAARERDPWSYWTFRGSLRGSLSGEKSYGSNSVYGSFSANRTTEEWKVRTSLSGSREESRFELGDDRTIRNRQRSYGANALVARSLGEHLSAGGRASASSSTYLNQELALRLAPAVEYSLFPYSESTRRQLTVQYSVGASAFDYREETIFGKLEETRLDHSLLVSLDTRQRWGSASLGLEGASYLDDFSKRRFSANGNVDVRLFKGLSLSGFASAARISDQLYLRRGEATPEEILLRQRQLATSYSYFASVGLSYTFGSIFNNVVNPRFGGASGGSVIILN